ncbi:MAG: sulfate/thiosulfate transport system permease protein [Ilumatobacteraceae bacterium]|jgi:sulfate transport system permease protein|nr:sulfate/thiosulfate transport system permease protein [Ilumatobacteraceae bacterium]
MHRYALRFVGLGYLTLLVGVPVALIFWRTFEHGVGPVLSSLGDPKVLHAFRVTAIVALWAVVLNTVFGVGAAILLVRHRFPGRRLLSVLIDLPIAVSPVVVGLALILVYGKHAPIGGWLDDRGIKVIFAYPGMVLATMFVSLPLVVREVAPVLEEIGIEQEQAAWTLGANGLQTFRRVTLPAIRWALAYGVVLTLARSLGEYGAVAVVSGRLIGKTQTATLIVDERFQNFDQGTAYAVSVTLALVAILILVLINVLRPKEHI